jgi:hypothetical protein
MTSEYDETVGSEAPKLHRSRRTRNRRKWNAETALPYLWNGLTLLVLATAVLVFLLLEPIWWPFGGALLAIGLLGGALRLHYHVLNNHRLWLAECPRCDEHSLRRMRRSVWHRMASWAGIPVRPYICNSCGWRGSRIDHTKIM